MVAIRLISHAAKLGACRRSARIISSSTSRSMMDTTTLPSPPAKKLKLDTESQPIAPTASLNLKPADPKRKHKKFKKPPPPEPGSSEDVILRDVFALLGESNVKTAEEDGLDYTAPIEKAVELELTVSSLSSNGEALCLLPGDRPWAVVLPFALPGEVVRCRVYAHSRMHSLADFVSLVTSSQELRDDNRARCRYFGVCAGCQYQMLSYEKQLELKRTVVEKAYRNFSNIPAHLVPTILPAMPSPLQYAYRTKITPHFELPRKPYPPEPNVEIGFAEKGRRRILDIEECVIATSTINKALPAVREKVKKNIATYKRGATLLLRDSFPVDPGPSSTPTPHECLTDHKVIARERVGEVIFEFPAGSFFQNNNSILPSLVSYVQSSIPSSTTHLVDTYCGVGFFAISLASQFKVVSGVEISDDAVKFARRNAQLNGCEGVTFTAGKAEFIFDDVSHFPPNETAVIIDPPRKGCDVAFLKQLASFKPGTLVYVSCNVHTQARDVGNLLKLMQEEEGTYRIQSIRGFDLFPQTAHVESVAVLTLGSKEQFIERV